MVLAISALITTACQVEDRDSHVVQIASSRLDPQSFAVTHNGNLIGTSNTSGKINNEGEYEFRSVFLAASTTSSTFRTEQKLKFHGEPPFALIEATYNKYVLPEPEPYYSVVLSRIENQYVFNVNGNQAIEVEVQYGLRDFLAFELWILEPSSARSGRRSIRSIDFEEPGMRERIWEIDEEVGARHVFMSSKGIKTEYYLLDGVPLFVSSIEPSTGLTIAPTGGSELQTVDSPVSVFTPHIEVPVNTPIARPRELISLHLRMNFENTKSSVWNTLLSDNDELVTPAIRTTRRVGSSESEHSFHKGRYPINSREIQTLLTEVATNKTDSHALLNDLVRFTNEYVLYDDSTPLKDVLTTVADRRGDCSEISELFTTLARAAGLQARTVMGLAYDSGSESFRIHAWNEVTIDDSIRHVDPTWNQLDADATHIEFPNAQAYEVLQSLRDMELSVVKTQYASPRS